MQNSIDGLLQAAVANGDVPGVTATVARADRLLYTGAFGERELGADAPMTPDSVLWIASMSKALTAAAAMQLVERGELDLDAPAAEYAPAIGEAQVLEGFDSNGQPQLRAPKTPVTLRHLLTHTSGFSYEIWNPVIAQYQEATGLPGVLGACKNSLKMPLVSDPGERWEYGLSMAWAGQVVEAVSGQKLGDFLQQSLFEPLGMHDTVFKITSSMRERLASMHARGADGALAVFPFEVPQDAQVQMGGEALYSTALDYQRFLRMLLGRGELDGQRVLQAATVASMGQNQMGEINVTDLKTAIPMLSNDTRFFPHMREKWGFSFLINTEQTPQGRSAGSMSWAGLSNCYYWIDPTKNVSGAIYTQIMPFFDAKVVALFREFESAVYTALE